MTRPDTMIATRPHPPRPSFHPGQPIDPLAIEQQGSLVLPGYLWDHYLSLDALFQGTGTRVRFLDNHIEIMAPISEKHEERKTLLGFLVESWCAEHDVEAYPRGSATLKIPDQAGGEPDESYHFHTKKDHPDLVIEVALTTGGLSKRAFYAKFKIPELWIWREEKLEVHHFDPATSTYESTTTSALLPDLDLTALAHCATLPTPTQALREFHRRTTP